VTIQLTSAVRIAGAEVASGTRLALGADTESVLVGAGQANYVDGGILLFDWNTITNTLGNNAVAYTGNKDGYGANKGIKLVQNSSGSYCDGTVIPAGWKMGQTPVLTVYVYAPEGQGTRIVRVLVSTTGNFSAYLEAVCEVRGIGWQAISIPMSGWSVTGSFDWAADVNLVRVRANDDTVTYNYSTLGAGEYILCGSFVRDDVRLAKVLITIDDGKASPLTSWKALLDRFGFRATTNIYPSGIGRTGAGYATLNQLKVLRDAGWTIGNHSMSGATDGANSGLKLLGPFGQGIAISAFGSNQITVASGRAPFDPQPVKFAGAGTPSGVTAGTTYYARNVSSTVFQLHPTLDDAYDNTNQVTFTGGTAGTCTWSYSVGAADHTGIVADLTKCAQWVADHRLGDGLHVALPQGAWDINVATALRAWGPKTVRAARNNIGSNSAAHCRVLPGAYGSRNGNAEPYGQYLTFPAVFDVDNQTTVECDAWLASLIAQGGIGCILSHGFDSTKATFLCQKLRDYLLRKQIEVLTPEDYYATYGA
jgi:hypothetical protein